jgi:molybdopterin synthase sulfur carrier subunit
MTATGQQESARVTVRYWAAARDAAGCEAEQLPAGTLAELIKTAGERHGGALSRLLSICSYLVDAQPVKLPDAGQVQLVAGAHVEVLPPFAGGSQPAQRRPPPRA